MPTTKLTKAVVERIKAPDPSGKQVLHWDSELRGFGLLASGTTGAKTYVVQKRLPSGQVRRCTIGSAAAFSLDKARADARDLLVEMSRGKDPKAERRAALVRDRTLAQWLDSYLAARKDLAERSRRDYRTSIQAYLKSWLELPLRQISSEMVEEMHSAIAADVAKRSKGKRSGGGETNGGATANGVFRVFRAVWNHAAERDPSLPANPCKRLRRSWFAQPRRERLVTADQLPAFYAALEALESRTARDFLKLTLFTGFRKGEAAALKWPEIDFTARLIRLSAKRTKAGRKLDLPMSSFVRDLLVARRAIGHENEFVFPADSRSGHIEEPRFHLDLIAEATGIAVSTHDLRRTFATVAESCDISPLALKCLVNHALGDDVTSGYVRITTDRLREPAQRVCDRMLELCGISAPEGVAKLEAVQ